MARIIAHEGYDSEARDRFNTAVGGPSRRTVETVEREIAREKQYLFNVAEGEIAKLVWELFPDRDKRFASQRCGWLRRYAETGVAVNRHSVFTTKNLLERVREAVRLDALTESERADARKALKAICSNESKVIEERVAALHAEKQARSREWLREYADALEAKGTP